MIISFSGAQSTGKTTLLNHLMSRNPGINFVPEVTRKIKRELNLPINEEGNALTQYMIMAEHIRNVYCNREDINILDRCALDGLVYTHWLADNNSVSLLSYTSARSVYDRLIDEYDIIFYTDPKDVELEDDGERSVNTKFRSEITALFDHYMKFKSDNIIVLSGTIEQRLNKIKSTLESYNIDIKI